MEIKSAGWARPPPPGVARTLPIISIELQLQASWTDLGLDTIDHRQYLGVFLSHKFKWDFKYNHIAKKADQVLGMLRRNLRECSRSVKSTAYLALMRPNLEYASGVCGPYESKYINKLEMIQWKLLDLCAIITTGVQMLPMSCLMIFSGTH